MLSDGIPCRLLLRRPSSWWRSGVIGFCDERKINMALSTCEGRASRAAAAQRFPQMETFYFESDEREEDQHFNC